MNTDARYEYEYINVHGYELIETKKKNKKVIKQKKHIALPSAGA